MFHAAVLVMAMTTHAPAQKGYCSCTGACVCGCQQGKDCPCPHDGKRLPPKRQPEPKTAEPKKEQEQAKAEPLKMPTTEPDGVKLPTGTHAPSYPPGMPNFGIDMDKLSKRPKYTHNDKEISVAQAMDLIENGVPDDRHKLRLTIIGPEAERRRVVADLDGPAFAQLRDQYVVQSYDPANVMIHNLGFVVSGKPTIYLQRPDGLVLHRQDEYHGPERLAEAIRKADPNYDPNKDPDLNKPKPAPGPGPGPFGPGGPDLSRVPVWAWGALIIGLFLLLQRDERRDGK